jgi:hypothetical protein
VKDHAHTLSDFRVSTLSIQCESCGRRGRYNVARLIEKYGDMKLPELRHVLANCPKVNRPASTTRARLGTARTAGFDPRLLQTGIGTAHTTPISAAISTMVIFSLVDRSMASLRTRCQSQRCYTRPLVLKL